MEGIFHLFGQKQPQLPFPENAADAEKIWQDYLKRLEQGSENGTLPMLFRCDADMMDWLDELEEEELLISEEIPDGKTFLQERLALLREDLPELDKKTDLVPSAGKHRPSALHSWWKRNAPTSIVLAEIPVKHPWEILYRLPIGGWNDCPNPEEILAVLQYWHAAYGAIPVSIGSDTLECYVPTPAGDRAWELALEQYAFCYDIVDQGYETVAALAAELQQSTIWSFWWD